MVKFVRLHLADGGWLPVNPDLVAYVRPRGAFTAVVFGALPGGLHEVTVDHDADQVLALLEGVPPLAREAEPAEDLARVPFDDGWAPGEAKMRAATSGCWAAVLASRGVTLGAFAGLAFTQAASTFDTKTPPAVKPAAPVVARKGRR